MASYLGGDGSKAASNTIVASAESGVNVYGNNNQISGNTVIDAPTGVLISSGTGTQISGEKNYAVNQAVVTTPPPPTVAKARTPVHRR